MYEDFKYTELTGKIIGCAMEVHKILGCADFLKLSTKKRWPKN